MHLFILILYWYFREAHQWALPRKTPKEPRWDEYSR